MLYVFVDEINHFRNNVEEVAIHVTIGRLFSFHGRQNNKAVLFAALLERLPEIDCLNILLDFQGIVLALLDSIATYKNHRLFFFAVCGLAFLSWHDLRH